MPERGGSRATGVVVPAHGSATVTPVVAKASAGAVEHLPVAVVPNLARYLAEIKRDDLWVYAAAGEAPQTLWETDFSGATVLVLGAEGKGLRPLVRRTCDAACRSRCRAGRVVERQCRRSAAPLRGEAPAWLTRRSTSSTATTSCTRAASATRASCATSSRASSPCAARAACSSSTGRGATRRGPLDVRYAANADALIERLAGENRDRRASLRRVVGRDDPRHGGAAGADDHLAGLPGRVRRRSSSERKRSELADRLDPRRARRSSDYGVASLKPCGEREVT